MDHRIPQSNEVPTHERFSGTYVVRDTEGDCLSAPLTKFRADYVGYFNDNTLD